MVELTNTELVELDGGHAVGDFLILAGTTVIAVSSLGTVGVVAGVAIGVVAFIGNQ